MIPILPICVLIWIKSTKSNIRNALTELNCDTMLDQTNILLIEDKYIVYGMYVFGCPAAEINRLYCAQMNSLSLKLAEISSDIPFVSSPSIEE